MPIQVVQNRLWTPSLKSGYARTASESANPGLWQAMHLATPFMLGNTGVPRNFGTFRKGPYGTVYRREADTAWVRSRGMLGMVATADTSTSDIEIPHMEAEGLTPLEYTVLVFVSGITDTTIKDLNIWSYENGTQAIRTDTVAGVFQMAVQTTSATYKFDLTTDPSDGGSYVVVSRVRTLLTEGFVNGTHEASQITAGTTDWVVYNANRRHVLLSLRDNSTFTFDQGALHCFYLWGRALSTDEITHLSSDPLAPFRLKSRSVAFPNPVAVPAAGSSIQGFNQAINRASFF